MPYLEKRARSQASERIGHARSTAEGTLIDRQPLPAIIKLHAVFLRHGNETLIHRPLRYGPYRTGWGQCICLEAAAYELTPLLPS